MVLAVGQRSTQMGLLKFDEGTFYKTVWKLKEASKGRWGTLWLTTVEAFVTPDLDGGKWLPGPWESLVPLRDSYGERLWCNQPSMTLHGRAREGNEHWDLGLQSPPGGSHQPSPECFAGCHGSGLCRSASWGSKQGTGVESASGAANRNAGHRWGLAILARSRSLPALPCCSDDSQAHL